jgi:methylase of polypeptide subunit release factors
VTEAPEIERVREAFARAEYTEMSLLRLFGPTRLPGGPGRDLAHFLHLTRGGSFLETLARLFLLSEPVPVAALEQAEAFAGAGLIELRGDTAVPLLRVQPYRGLLLACDRQDRFASERAADSVVGLTSATATLADFTVRRPVGRALDVGTGSGIQALLAARHSREVRATDLNPRALQIARLNAMLNGFSNVCFREGNAFEPVAGERFALIVSNPPFAVSPGRRYVYRDSGRAGDRFCEQLIRQAPAFLDDGGLLQMTFDWVHRRGRDWRERLAGWVAGCDAWFLRIETQEPPVYVRNWLESTEPGGADEAARLYEEWISYFEREGIEAVSTGLVALRRSSRASHWVRFEDAPERGATRFGDDVLLGFALRDFLETKPDLLALPLRAAPYLKLEQTCEWSEGGWQVASARLRLAAGLQYTGAIDGRVANLLAGCDGRRTLRELIEELAAGLGVGVESIAGSCRELAEHLVERGFLLPQGIAPLAPAGPTAQQAGDPVWL